MNQNIFQLWDSIGRKIPFAVRRSNWPPKNYAIVDGVEIGKWPYGKAYGYPTTNGVPSKHYSYHKSWRKSREIPSAGCYQWELVHNANFEYVKKEYIKNEPN